MRGSAYVRRSRLARPDKVASCRTAAPHLPTIRRAGRAAAGASATGGRPVCCRYGCCRRPSSVLVWMLLGVQWGPSCVTRDGGPGTGGASTNFYALSVGAVPTGTAPWCHAVRYMLATMPTAVRTAVVRSSPVCTRTARSRANCTSRRTVGREAGEQVGRFLGVAVLAGLLAARDALVYGVVEAGEVAA